jgi:hypothetical protein
MAAGPCGRNFGQLAIEWTPAVIWLRREDLFIGKRGGDDILKGLNIYIYICLFTAQGLGFFDNFLIKNIHDYIIARGAYLPLPPRPLPPRPP